LGVYRAEEDNVSPLIPHHPSHSAVNTYDVTYRPVPSEGDINVAESALARIRADLQDRRNQMKRKAETASVSAYLCLSYSTLTLLTDFLLVLVQSISAKL
jgi:hypothetical protein